MIIILCERAELLTQTLSSLQMAAEFPFQIVIARPSIRTQAEQTVSWFLGKAYILEDLNGSQLFATTLYTLEALLIVEAGDQISPEFFKLGISTLNVPATNIEFWLLEGDSRKIQFIY